MKAIVFEIEGTINVAERDFRNRSGAALRVLSERNITDSPDEFFRGLQASALAFAQDIFHTTLWRLFSPYSRLAGMDRSSALSEWDSLWRDFQGHAGYAFDLREGARGLLEDLRFNLVDNMGEFPRVIAYSPHGEMAANALEHAHLLPLFDQGIFLGGESRSQPLSRLADRLASALSGLNAAPHNALFVGSSLNGALAAASEIEAPRLLFNPEGSLWGGVARSPEEEPYEEVQTVDELGDMINFWLNSAQHSKVSAKESQT